MVPLGGEAKISCTVESLLERMSVMCTALCRTRIQSPEEVEAGVTSSSKDT